LKFAQPQLEPVRDDLSIRILDITSQTKTIGYYRFTLSYRDVQELLFERGITVSHEAVRQWCQKIGRDYANPASSSPTS
jgi:hypothetical protein